MTDRRQRRFERTRAAIDEAGRSLLGRIDESDLTVKMVADAADISAATFYSHYDGKAEFVSHLVDESTVELGQSARSILGSSEPAASRYARFVATVLNDVRRHPDWTRFVLGLGGHQAIGHCVLHEPMTELIVDGIAQGTFRGVRRAELGLVMTRGAALAAYAEGLRIDNRPIDAVGVVRSLLLILDTEPVALEAALDVVRHIAPEHSLRRDTGNES
jgi:AcrR family transcriptional regulator